MLIAIALPSPRLPPVMIAIFICFSLSILFLMYDLFCQAGRDLTDLAGLRVVTVPYSFPKRHLMLQITQMFALLRQFSLKRGPLCLKERELLIGSCFAVFQK